MLISQTQAVEKIKAETGLVEADCLAIVRRLPKRLTGKREKVYLSDVEKEIAIELRPVKTKPLDDRNVRPFSPKLVNRIRRSGARV